MAIDLTSKHEVSWKDKLLGNGISNPKTSSISTVNGNEDDLILLGGDVRKSTLNGIPTIELSERKILEEIGRLVGKVAKLDFMIDKGSSGRFPRMAVYVNLDQPLVLQILINVKTLNSGEKEVSSEKRPIGENTVEEIEAFRPWMLVEWKKQCNPRDSSNQSPKNQGDSFGSRFMALSDNEGEGAVTDLNKKGKLSVSFQKGYF
ncbi:hypothetical protein Gogos_012773 [Gossypium gossypioides]|uniref:DUF4283 domain-containing protein n=1 Tax=Gossypium gossypioides TaxID=34282 RepID=A0A7J9BTI9_GOSGO|nr:hypothetical protein [Gossypium gossypioides]